MKRVIFSLMGIGLLALSPAYALDLGKFKGAVDKVKAKTNEVAPSVGANAEDRKTFNEAAAKMNKVCESNIKATANFSEFKNGSATYACQPIFDELQKACQREKSYDPLPAGQEFIREHVKTISCVGGVMPAQGKPPVVTITRTGTELKFAPPPDVINTGWETQAEFKKKFTDLGTHLRLFYAKEQFDEAAAKTNEICGSKIEMSADVPSWQKGGSLLKYPDLAVEEICNLYLGALEKACKAGNSASISSNIKRVVCIRGEGKEFEHPRLGKGVKPNLKGGTLTLHTAETSNLFDQSTVIQYLRNTLKLKGLEEEHK